MCVLCLCECACECCYVVHGVWCVLCVVCVQELDEAIAWNNEVDQGLTSALFTSNTGDLFKWLGSVYAQWGQPLQSSFICEYHSLPPT